MRQRSISLRAFLDGASAKSSEERPMSSRALHIDATVAPALMAVGGDLAAPKRDKGALAVM